MAIHDSDDVIETQPRSQMQAGLEAVISQMHSQEIHLNDTPIVTPNVSQSSPAPLQTFESLLNRDNVRAKLEDDLIAAPGRILQAGINGATELWRRVRG